MQTYAEIKSNTDIVEVATNKLGLKVRQISNDEYRGYSLDGGNNDTCLSINANKGLWHDFKTGQGGSVLDLVAYEQHGIITKETIHEAYKFLGGENGGFFDSTAQAQKSFKSDVDLWHGQLLRAQKILDYIHERKITDETIKKYKIGLCNETINIDGQNITEWRLTFPYMTTYGEPFYMVSRCLPGYSHNSSNGKPVKYHKLWLKNKRYAGYIRNGLFGLNTLRKSRDLLVIGEGIFDCLSFMQEGFTTLFSVGGFFSDDQLKSLIEIAKTFNGVALAYDSDESGTKFTAKLGKILMENDIEFIAIRNYGEGHKDVSDYYTAGGDLEELIKNAEEGYYMMARSLRLPNPFRKNSKIARDALMKDAKDFMILARDHLDKTQMKEIEKILKEYFPENKVNELMADKSFDDAVCYVRDRFLRLHEVISTGSRKAATFYEYKQAGGYWMKRTDGGIEGEIDKFLLRKKTSRYVNEILAKIRMATYVDEEDMPQWNGKRLMAFKNGVLELDTGELRDPVKEDYLYGAPRDFDYNSSATCPTFDRVMKEWFDFCEDREATANDSLGYTLFADCPFQKAFYLLGDEGTGKSTFLEVLEMIFGTGITHVMPAMLSKATNRVLLEGSLLNLANEMKGEIGKADDYFRKVISGEIIDGERKFYDNHSFRPRAKWFCTSNDGLKADCVKGLRRRMVFIKFARKIKDVDPNLKDKLMAERSGIFNRIYNAYRELLARGYIRECRDQKEMIRDFELNSDTVVSFWEARKESLAGTENKKSDVFKWYAEFCNEQRIACERPHNFQRKFRALLLSEGLIGEAETWDGKFRSYRIAPLPEPKEEEKAPNQPEQVSEPQQQKQPEYRQMPNESREQYVTRVGIKLLCDAYSSLPYDVDGRSYYSDDLEPDRCVTCDSILTWIRYLAKYKNTPEWQEILAKFEGMREE